MQNMVFKKPNLLKIILHYISIIYDKTIYCILLLDRKIYI